MTRAARLRKFRTILGTPDRPMLIEINALLDGSPLCFGSDGIHQPLAGQIASTADLRQIRYLFLGIRITQ